MRISPTGLAAALAAAAVGIVGWVFLSDDGVTAGGALGLEDDNKITHSGGRFHVGQEIVAVLGQIENESSTPLEISEISFPSESIENVQLLDVGIIGWKDGVENFPQGTFQTLPLAIELGEEECLREDPEPAEGFELKPGEVAVMAFHIRFEHSGPFRLESPAISYASSGKEYFEVAAIERSGTVEDSSDDRPVRGILARCTEPSHVLPGNRLR